MSDEERAMDRDPDEALIAKLATAMGRVDAGSVGGYAFRRHVAEADLLPLVKALLKQQAEEIAQRIEAERAMPGRRYGPIAMGSLGIAASLAREIGAR